MAALKKINSMADIPRKDLIGGGTFACPGCGPVTGLRYVFMALGKKTIMVNTSGCMTLTAAYPFTPFKVPWIHNAIENGASTATGIIQGLRALKKDKGINVVVYAGDGATYDIGIQSLSGAANRGNDIIYVCYNNASFANTGFQRSQATPKHTTLPTHPKGSKLRRKNMARIMADHGIAYSATACTSYPVDFIKKLQKAAEFSGFKFIDLLSPCVPGWGIEDSKSVAVGKAMVETGLWPMYELVGKEFSLSMNPKRKKVEYALKMQKRFASLKKKEINEIQEIVDAEWNMIENGRYWETLEY